MPDQAFTMFAVDSPRTLRTIKDKLVQQRDGLVQSVAWGDISDWSHYQRQVGTIQGLDQAIKLCEEIEKQERQ